MLTTWIAAPLGGRFGAPARSGIWSAVVIGTNPIEPNQEVWLEVIAGEEELARLPGHWLENQGTNSLWHIPVPPQRVGVRLKYRAGAQTGAAEPAYSTYQEVVVRPNLPLRAESPAEASRPPEGLVGNRHMTVLVDDRAGTYDVYFPTVGLHSDVRPVYGDEPRSRCHFRAIVAGLSAGHRLDWFCERDAWEAFQYYQGSTNLLVTELKWRDGPIRVVITDFVAAGSGLPSSQVDAPSPGQYIKRFRIINDGPRSLPSATFGVLVHAEINGGVGETGLSWEDGDATLVAFNRGHAHANRKLARDSTVEFAVALDGRGPVRCEPIGPSEAMILRTLDVPAGGSITLDLLVSGAFTGWRGDSGTFQHQLQPALAWFRSVDIDAVERQTAEAWERFLEPVPTPILPRAPLVAAFRRAALAAALHADADWGAVASGYERGILAYGWPRDAASVGAMFDRIGQPELGRKALEWLGRVGVKVWPYTYWFDKYTIDGWPEWETPALDQSAMVPWAVEQHYRRIGDRAFLAACWPMVEQAAEVCLGHAGHPGLRWHPELSLVESSGLWDRRYGSFLYANACAVAGLRAAARVATELGKSGLAGPWKRRAEQILTQGILAESPAGSADRPGLVDPEAGRFLEARRVSIQRGLWTERPDRLRDRSAALDVATLGLAVPLRLLPAQHPYLRASVEAILQHNRVEGEPVLLAHWTPDPQPGEAPAPGSARRQPPSSLATLWVARYLFQLGRETGDGSAWARGLTLLEGIVSRLCPLGVGLRSRRSEAGESACSLPGVAELYAPLIETMLDLMGLDYDAAARVLTLDPVLPPSWAHVGLDRTLPCGSVAYRLERPVGRSSYRLTLDTELKAPVTLSVGITCPGLAGLGAWLAEPAMPAPSFAPETGRLGWRVALPAGASSGEWTWG